MVYLLTMHIMVGLKKIKKELYNKNLNLFKLLSLINKKF